MNEAVEEIIRSVETGLYFDSHFVIDTLIRDYSDVYLAYAAANPATGKITEHLHGAIAKIIGTFDGTLVSRVHDSQSKSYNIRGRASTCVLWKRV